MQIANNASVIGSNITAIVTPWWRVLYLEHALRVGMHDTIMILNATLALGPDTVLMYLLNCSNTTTRYHFKQREVTLKSQWTQNVSRFF